MNKLITLFLCFWISTINYAGLHTAPTTMESYSVWDNFQEEIYSDPDKQITILWEGYGGYIRIATDFISFLESLRNKIITIILIGPALSAHALVVCNADNIIWGEQGFLLFHPASAYKDRPDAASAMAVYEVYRNVELCVKKGILSEKLARLSVRNKEIWIKQNKKGGYNILIKSDDRIGANK